MKKIVKKGSIIVLLFIILLVLSGCENESKKREALYGDISDSISKWSENSYDEIRDEIEINLSEECYNDFDEDKKYNKDEIMEILSDNSESLEDKIFNTIENTIKDNAHKLDDEVYEYIENFDDNYSIEREV